MKKKMFICLLISLFLLPIQVKADSNVIYSETINAVDGVRYENFLVYYHYNETLVTGTNVWGYEVSVDENNVVIEVGTNVKMQPGGYALSAHGTKKTLLQNVQIGDIVSVDLGQMHVEIVRDPVQSSYFRSLSNLTLANNRYQAAFMRHTQMETEVIQSLLQEMETDFQKLYDLYALQSLTLEQQEMIVTYGNQIERNKDMVIYRTTNSSSIEMRALWHRPNATSIKEENLNGLIRFLDKVQELGFNTIYLETFWNGYASYRSEILETHPKLDLFQYGSEYGNDYTLAFITEANKRNIDVHAWVHTFNAGNNTYLSNQIQSDWLVENYQGDTLHPNTYGGSYYLDPSNPEVLTFVNSFLTEMTEKYNFAGIQLDYIRYYDNNYQTNPIRDSGYNAQAEALFQAKYGLSGDTRTLILTPEYRLMWNEWRQQNITSAVKLFSENLRAINPKIIISADVVPDITEARNTYMQDWLTWVQNGYIDLLCPMIYTSSVDRVEAVSKELYDQLGNMAFLSSGIASIYYNNSILNQLEQINATALTGGSAIFASHNVVGNEDAEASLQVGIFRNTALTPFDEIETLTVVQVSRLKELISAEIDDVNIKNMFLLKLDELLSMPGKNPSDYQKLKIKVDFIQTITPYLQDEILDEIVTLELSKFAHILDTRITRELIQYGHYSPENEDRPNPDDFDYPNEEPQNPDPVDPTPENPDDETESPNGLIAFISIGVLLILIIQRFVFMMIKRRKI